MDAWGNVHPQDAVVENGTPVVSLEWTTNQPTIKCLVQRRQEDSSEWIGISPWLSFETTKVFSGHWVMAFTDKSVSTDRHYWYRIISVNKAGKRNISVESSTDGGVE
jgi:hypothetical protein